MQSTFTIGCIAILVLLLGACASNTNITNLYDAIRNNTLSDYDTKRIASLYEVKAPIGDYNLKAIHVAAHYSSDVQLIEGLSSADIDASSSEKLFGATPLHIAAGTSSSPEIIAHLLEDNEINVPDYNLDTPLHWFFSRKNNNLPVLQILMAQGASVQAKNLQDSTALHLALRGSTQMLSAIEVLIAAGASLNEKNKNGLTPLHLLAQSPYADPSAVRLLVSHGADINAEDTHVANTPLHIAAMQSDNPELIRGLIAEGAALEQKNTNNETPLHLAAWANRHAKIIQTLLNEGANVQAQGTLYNVTPLHMAAWNNAEPGVLQTLITAGANVNAQDMDGDTPLHLAIRNNQNFVPIAETLLFYGADADIENNQGISAMDLAEQIPILHTLFAPEKMQ